MTLFTVVGNVGRITKKKLKNTTATFLAIATTSFYKGKAQTQWINNIVFYGAFADIISEKVVVGNKLYVQGTINVQRKSNKDNIFFIGEKFNILNRTDEQKAEQLQKRAVDNMPEDEDMYASPEESEDSDNLPY